MKSYIKTIAILVLGAAIGAFITFKYTHSTMQHERASLLEPYFRDMTIAAIMLHDGKNIAAHNYMQGMLLQMLKEANSLDFQDRDLTAIHSLTRAYYDETKTPTTSKTESILFKARTGQGAKINIAQLAELSESSKPQ